MRKFLAVFLLASIPFIGVAQLGVAQCVLLENGTKVENDGTPWQLQFRPQPELLVGEFFALQIRVCEDNQPWSGQLTVDASMPAHGHGMNYRPEVAVAGPGDYVAEGLLFHMPGRWRVDFTIEQGESSHHIYSFIDVK